MTDDTFRPHPRVIASIEHHREIRARVTDALGFLFAIACVAAIGFGWLS